MNFDRCVLGFAGVAATLVVFAAIWCAFGPVVNLWVLTAAACAAGLTFVFWLNRRSVIRTPNEKWWRELLRLQVSCLPLIALSAFMVNALDVQGIHPITGQLAALCALVVGACLAGWNPAAIGIGAIERAPSIRQLSLIRFPLFALAVFAPSLLLFDHIWAAPFYSSLSHVGHDFALAGIGLLEGKFWIDSNGMMAGFFNPPWFTPAWCAGTAYYADPQSAFYSPLMALALWFDPFFAAHLSVLLFASVAYWGSYILARRVLGWQSAGAIVFSVLGMANAFMPMRSATGEVGYQPLYLWTLLALTLCWPAAKGGWRSAMWPMIVVCACLTIWLQYAFAGMMVPVFLATLMFCFVAVLFGRASLRAILLRSFVGGVLAIVLNASKLYESASLMRQFPRDFYALPGFPSFSDALLSVAYGLLQPSEWTAEFGMRKLVKMQFTAFPHEWAMHFGLGAVAAVLVCSLALLLRKRVASDKAPIHFSAEHWLAVLGLLLISAVPLMLLWDQDSIRGALKRIPILNSAAWPMRWIIVYLPVTQFLLALPAVIILRSSSVRGGFLATAAISTVIWFGPLAEPIGYYTNAVMQSYDPKPVIAAFRKSLDAPPIPIREIIVPEGRGLTIDRNDTMLNGASQGACYNPIYGYRLEAFPQPNRLQAGAALATDTRGESLIFNPACLVHPAENSCSPGDGFKVNIPEQQHHAERFLDRKPFRWNRPLMGGILSVISQSAFWLLLMLVMVSTTRRIIRLN